MGGPRANEGRKSNEDPEDKGSTDEESDRRDRPHETLLNNDGMISKKRNETPLVFGPVTILLPRSTIIVKIASTRDHRTPMPTTLRFGLIGAGRIGPGNAAVQLPRHVCLR